jgi:stage V sporulation protein AE
LHLNVVLGHTTSYYQEIRVGLSLGSFISAFIVGGLICVIGQLMMDLTSLTPAHVLSILVVAGAVLDGLGLYDPLIAFAGAGATVPISNFGNSLVHGALTAVNEDGLIGVLTGIFQITSAGISAAIIFGLLTAFIFKPKG